MKNEYNGLTEKEVLNNQEIYGKNIIIYKEKNKLLKNIINILKEPMFLLLIICVVLYAFLGELTDAIILGIAVICVIGIQVYQQIKTNKTIESLQKIKVDTCKVIRNGKEVTINSDEVTIDDIMVLSEGDKIIADAIILESYNLHTDESILTGESIPVSKSYDLLDKEAVLKSNYVYSGTLITKGNGIAKVTNIGNKTEYGKIATHLSNIIEENSPLQKQINSLVKVFTIIAIIAFILVSILVGINNQNIIDGILSGLTIAMGAIPEEFPLVLTVFLSMGAYRIAKNNAIIKNLSSVETLGEITYLCVDKTGTITENKMEVKEFYTTIDNNSAILNCLLASEVYAYDPMEQAIIDYASKNNVRINDEYQLIKKFPFTNETKMMANIYEYKKEKYIFVKGALESLFDICELDVEEKYKLYNFQKQLSKKGLRVIAFASKKIDEVKEDLLYYNVEFNGIIGLYDPPKKNVKKSIKICKDAGIKVMMITGDNKETASAIGKQIGIENYKNVISGKELENMSDEELTSKIKTIGIFARVIPEHKLRIINALKNNNEIVAMTGDGVNDAPALKSAEIGISMGKRGTEVAKEASDLILLDDNFTTIVNTIKDARRIYQNIKKSIYYILIIHIPLILLSIMIPLFHYPMLLLPIHIVILEMMVDPTCSIIFERHKGNNNIMKVPPKDKKEKLVNKKTAVNAVIKGIIIFTFVFVSYIMLIDNKGVATSFSFGMLILSNILLAYSILFENSDLESIKQVITDKVALIINSILIVVVLLFIYVPYINNIFKTSPLSVWLLILMIILSFVSIFITSLFKIRRKN